MDVWTNRPIWPSGQTMPKANKSLKPKSLNWDLWLGPAKNTEYIPNMHPFNWRGWWDYGTGALGDMGCHLIDVPFKALGLKYPKSVECSIGKFRYVKSARLFTRRLSTFCGGFTYFWCY